MLIYTPDEIAFYKSRSYGINPAFNDVSYGLGVILSPSQKQTLKLNFGRSFRLPGANELAANGVHHGTFRHELGDTSLNSETGFHFDLAYIFDQKKFYFSINPFVNWFDNYIFLEPTGNWSVLPHAGQIYRYKQARSLIAGGEITVTYEFLHNFTIETGVEYVFMQNMTDGYALPFSPPLSVMNGLVWHSHRERRWGKLHWKLEHQSTSRQNRIARNETKTPEYNLYNLSLNNSIVKKKITTDVSFQVQNIFNNRYYNHLSYYRKLNIPEPGRNLQVIVRFTFN
jgi:iron complex outermembrane receptor protein